MAVDEGLWGYYMDSGQESAMPIINPIFTGDLSKCNDIQPAPIKSKSPAIWDLVIRDMVERDGIGTKKYGTRLQPNNGRKALVDAYQEALDLVVYLRQAIYELEGK
jgi:hypothetical protein